MIETVRKERRILKQINHRFGRTGKAVNTDFLLKSKTENYYLEQLRIKHLIAFNIVDDYQQQGSLAIPTESGLHFFEQRWENVRSFLIRSVAVPIGVSAITTLITIWVHSLFD